MEAASMTDLKEYVVTMEMFAPQDHSAAANIW